MKSSTVKVYAKINLTLDVLGIKENFHVLESLVASIDLCDAITVCKRNDNNITLKTLGIDCQCPYQKNNAVKTAKLFQETFNTSGVDIVLEKNIPVGAGLGGSSADIAGVLLAMKKVFDVSCDLTLIAGKLGSDSAYMLSGGYAVISGKGDEVKKLNIDKIFPLLIIYSDKTISAKDCYGEFDKQNEKYLPCTKKALEKLFSDSDEFFSVIKNDLYNASKNILPELETKIQDLKEANAISALMTGSGCAVYGVFESFEKRDIAFEILKSKYGEYLIKTQTVNL